MRFRYKSNTLGTPPFFCWGEGGGEEGFAFGKPHLVVVMFGLGEMWLIGMAQTRKCLYNRRSAG